MSGCSVYISLITVIIIIPHLAFASLSVSSVSLTTTLGQVTGVRRAAGGDKMVDIFYSIPFAKPPVGELRFRPPLQPDPWTGSLDGTGKPNSCWQAIDTSFGRFPGVEMWNPNTPMSEDCLYLNVWRPACIENCSQAKPKSILVWFYGGGFFSGTTTLDIYDATQLSVLNDVIVVSVAYRVGPFGFIYLDDHDVVGNVGLMDQVQGLKWVKENAANLGGSPDSITIFGESAGAFSVGFHLFSPLSSDYFSYAIMQSGAPFAEDYFADKDIARKNALTFAEGISCSKSNISASINCLRSASPESLITHNFSFRPIADGHFLPDHPTKMADRGDIKNTSVLLGVNKNEGIYFVIYDFKEYFPLDGNGEISEDQLDKITSYYFNGDSKTSDIVKLEYLKSPNTSYTDVADAIKGDKTFKCPVIRFAEALDQHGGDVFMYSFEHRVSTNPWPEWTGVVHGYEIELVFGIPLAPGNSQYTEEEKALSLQIMKLWTNFAKTG